MFNKGQLAGLMKEAQKMQTNLKRAQDELGLIEATGQAAQDSISIRMTCNYEVKGVRIDPALLQDADVEMLEDLITTALKDTMQQIEKTKEEKMGGLSQGMPAGFKLPF